MRMTLTGRSAVLTGCAVEFAAREKLHLLQVAHAVRREIYCERRRTGDIGAKARRRICGGRLEAVGERSRLGLVAVFNHLASCKRQLAE